MNAWRERMIDEARRSQLWQRWQGLPERDRKALALLGLFFVAVLFYSLLWLPVSHWRVNAWADYQRQQELHVYIQDNAASARQSRGRAGERLNPQQLQGVVTASAQKNGLALERFDNEAGGGLLVTLSQVPFTSLVRWLGQLQAQGVVLVEANLDGKGSGRVDARLTLALDGA
jgi:general secretion pathway protein M